MSQHQLSILDRPVFHSLYSLPRRLKPIKLMKNNGLQLAIAGRYSSSFLN
jgi:hypothetical protein